MPCEPFVVLFAVEATDFALLHLSRCLGLNRNTQGELT